MLFSITTFLITLLLLGIYTFFSLRHDGWRKYVGPCGFAIVVGLSLFGFSQSLGGCIPRWMAFNTKMDILAIAYDQPRAIYLWGVQDGKPKCLALPWTDEQAVQIRGQENEGGQLEYVKGSGAVGELHPKPQEALPEKTP